MEDVTPAHPPDPEPTASLEASGEPWKGLARQVEEIDRRLRALEGRLERLESWQGALNRLLSEAHSGTKHTVEYVYRRAGLEGSG